MISGCDPKLIFQTDREFHQEYWCNPPSAPKDEDLKEILRDWRHSEREWRREAFLQKEQEKINWSIEGF